MIDLHLCESIARDFPLSTLAERLGEVLNEATFRRERLAYDVRVGESGTRGHSDETLHKAMVGGDS